MRKLLKKQGFALVTDKLRSYSAAFRRLRLTCPHEQGLRNNNRVDRRLTGTPAKFALSCWYRRANRPEGGDRYRWRRVSELRADEVRESATIRRVGREPDHRPPRSTNQCAGRRGRGASHSGRCRQAGACRGRPRCGDLFPMSRHRCSPDSLLEETGFEPSVPRDTTEISRGLMSPLLEYPLTGKSRREREPTPRRRVAPSAGPRVRIQLAPAASLSQR
jgi:hypothetical protein